MKDISEQYNEFMDVCEDFHLNRKEFKPRELIELIQSQHGYSESALYKWVTSNYTNSMLEMRKIKKIGHGLYKFL